MGWRLHPLIPDDSIKKTCHMAGKGKSVRVMLQGTPTFPYSRSEKGESLMKFLIAGFGSIGRRHLRNLRALGYQDIILLRKHKSSLPEDEIKDVPVFASMEDALKEKPDGVIVANPSALHMEVAIPAAEAGCSILVEKPLSASLSEVGALRQALERGNGKILMGFQYRFHPGLRKALSLIQQGAIGKLLSFRVEWGEYLPGWHPWEDYRDSYSARKDLGGGVALTLCHPLDYLRWMFGEPAEIWGYSGKISDLSLEVDDIAEIGIRMAQGMVGSIHLDYYRRPVRNNMEISGSEGVMTWNNDDAMVTVASADGSVKLYPPADGFERNWIFLDEMRHFIDVTAGKVEPSCTVDDGVIVLQLAAALKLSSQEKRFILMDEVRRLG